MIHFNQTLTFLLPGLNLSTWVLTNNDIGTYIIIHCTKRQWKREFGLFLLCLTSKEKQCTEVDIRLTPSI